MRVTRCRGARTTAVGLGSLAAGAVAAVGWSVAGRVRDEVLRPFPTRPPSTRVVAVDRTRIVLRTLDGARAAGLRAPLVTGLVCDSCYLQLGPPEGADGPDVARPVVHAWGGLPAPGQAARLDEHAFPPDPAALAVPYREIRIEGPVGPLPAWEVPGTGDTWAIMIHGLGSTRSEGLRALAPTVRCGHPALLVSYRNDPEGPRTDGLARHGLTEWEDVEAAVLHARAAGARRVVLLGWSMGGALALGFAQRSSLLPMLAGLFLDSPLLDLRGAIDADATRSRPELATPLGRAALALGRAVAARRFGIDWGALDRRALAAELPVPLALAHGDADTAIPVAATDELALRHPQLVRYLRPPGVGHVRAWNADPAAYEEAVEALLRRASAPGEGGPAPVSSGA